MPVVGREFLARLLSEVELLLGELVVCVSFREALVSQRTPHAMETFKSPTVKSSATALISPEWPTAPQNRHLALSVLDCVQPLIFTSVLLLYAPAANRDFQTVVANLKDSLRRALAEYYPFAGRVTKGHNGWPEVRCDDSGAFFTEMVVQEELQEFGGRDAGVMFSGMEEANLRSTGIHSLDDLDEIPALVIQVTSFKCCSIALAVNWYHLVADGFSGFSFLKAWSELAQGRQISSPPDHRRQLLSARVPLQPHQSCPVAYRVLSAQPQKPQEHDDQGEANSQPQIIKEVQFTIPASEVQQLKKEVAECGQFTSGEAISAHLWRLVTKAKCLPQDAVSSYFTVVDGRKRLKDFPANYFGNCTCVTKTDCSAGELLDSPLGDIAKIIHESISIITDDFLRSHVDFYHVTGPSNVRPVFRERAALNILSTSWRFFPIYELDYGFGRPSYGGRNGSLTHSIGFAIVSPTPARDASVFVQLSLRSVAADALAATLKVEC